MFLTKIVQDLPIIPHRNGEFYVNHPYYPNPQEKFCKKKILSNQQGYIAGYLYNLKNQAVIMGVLMSILILVSLLIVLLDRNGQTLLAMAVFSAFCLLLVACAVVIYLIKKRKYGYILGVRSPQTLPTHMRCVKVKLWVFRGKYAIDIMGVWLFSDTGEKYLYIYPQNCRDKKALTIFPDNAVRKQIKATFQDRFLRFWYYEGTDLIYKFEEN